MLICYPGRLLICYTTGLLIGAILLEIGGGPTADLLLSEYQAHWYACCWQRWQESCSEIRQEMQRAPMEACTPTMCHCIQSKNPRGSGGNRTPSRHFLTSSNAAE